MASALGLREKRRNLTAGIEKERDPRTGVEEPAKAPKAGKLQASSESNWRFDVRNEKV